MATYAEIISKNIKYVTNEKGQETEAIISLKTPLMKAFFEDIKDLLLIQDRVNDDRVDFFEATHKILTKN